jgi:hypothetical protein
MKPIIKVEGIYQEMGLHGKAWKPLVFWKVSKVEETKGGHYKSHWLKDFATESKAMKYAKGLRARW